MFSNLLYILQGIMFLTGKWKIHSFWMVGIILCKFHLVDLSYVYDYGDGYLSDLGTSEWNSAGSRSVHPPRCVRIPPELTLCKNVVYENMSLPNLLGHDGLEEIKRQAQPWVPLKNLGCHPNTDLFLCSLYAPVCLDRPIYPCRSLCEAVQESCEARMNRYDYIWPEILKCDKFPLDDDLCIKQVDSPNDRGTGPKDTAANVCIPCKQPLTYESLLDSYCWAQFVIKGRIDNVTIDQNGDKRLHLRKSKFFKSANMTKKEKKKPLQVTITSGSLCDCEDATASKKKKLIMGNRQGDRFVVTYLSDWGKSSKGKSGKEFKRATRAMRKGHDCRAQIQEIAGQTDANNGGLSTNNEPPPESETNIEADLADTLKKTRKKKQKNKKDKKGKKDTQGKGKGKKKKGKKGKKGKENGRKGKGRKNRPSSNSASTSTPAP